MLCIDLYCGLGGWAEGFLSEGWDVIGFDIERHDYGTGVYPGQLVLQDVTTLHGSQFRNADVIVASPPCQAYSYRAMPWGALWVENGRMDDDGSPAGDYGCPDAIFNDLFRACFRIQREAIMATSMPCPECEPLDHYGPEGCSLCDCTGAVVRYIPLIVENVKGAQRWVGRAAWHYGSYYLWGDVPALMPPTLTRVAKVPGISWSGYGRDDYKAKGFNVTAVQRLNGSKNDGGSWFNQAHNTESDVGRNPVNGSDGTKHGGDWFSGYGGGFGWDHSQMRQHSSKSPARKAASAQIAKIPFPLAQHIARVFKPLVLA